MLFRSSQSTGLFLDLTQHVAAHRVDVAVGPEKALCSGSVQKGLNATMQEKAVKASVAEADAILVMLVEGVPGDLQDSDTWSIAP